MSTPNESVKQVFINAIPEDLISLGNEIRNFAKAGSKNVTELSRVLSMGLRVYSLAITVDSYGGRSVFHLSMVEQLVDENQQARIPNATAKYLALLLLNGGQIHEVPHQNGFVQSHARDFIKDVD